MPIRHLAVILLVLCCAIPAFGQGNSNAAQSSAGAEHGQGQQDNSNRQNDKGPKGNGPADAPGLGAPATPSSGTNPAPPGLSADPQVLTTEQMVEAVRTQQAKPLVDFAEAVNQDGGRVVDATLVRMGEILVYAIRVLKDDGGLTMQYYYARSGRYIGSQ